ELARVLPVSPPDSTTPGLFYLSADGALADALRAAGFRNVAQERVQLSQFAREAAEFWAMLADMAGPLAPIVAGLAGPERRLPLHRLEEADVARQNGDEPLAARQPPDGRAVVRRSVAPVHDRVGLDARATRGLRDDDGMRLRLDPGLQRRTAGALPPARRWRGAVDAERMLREMPAVGVHEAEPVLRRAQPRDERRDCVRRVVVPRAAEPRQASRHRERACVVGGDPEHRSGEARRDRKAAVEVEVLHAVDRQIGCFQELGARAADAGEAVIVDAVEQVP